MEFRVGYSWVVSVAAALLLAGNGFCGDTKQDRQQKAAVPGYCYAVQADGDVSIDGKGNEAFWKRAVWVALDQCYLGICDGPKDFSGRFKVAWKGSELFILAEITDDCSADSMGDGFDNYWQGDSIDIFIDEDQSGGEHLSDHNAFAYHVLRTGAVVDIDTDEQAKIFPDAVRMAVARNGDKYVWEMAVTVYSDKYSPAADSNETAKVLLQAGKKMGFSAAYSDNDGNGRDSLYGNCPEQGDTGHVTADQLGTLELVR